MTKRIIKNAQLVNEGKVHSADVLINEGRIEKIDSVIDVSGEEIDGEICPPCNSSIKTSSN